MVLTNKQKQDLHKAMLAYMRNNGFEEIAEQFAQEAAIDESGLEEKFQRLLEKKWTAIVRLQRKILQLEQQVKQLNEDLKFSFSGKKMNKSEALPREPAKFTCNGHTQPITKVKFHPIPGQSYLLTAGEDSQIKVWDFETGGFERTLKGHTDAVQEIDFSPDGSHLVSCSADLSIKMWNFETGKCVKTLHGHDHNVSSVQFLPSGNAIVSASRDKTMKMWDVQSGYCTKTYSGHDAWVRCVRVSPDGELLASCSMDQTIKIWNLKTGECLKTMRDHDHVVETIEFGNSAKVERNLMQLMTGEEQPPLPEDKKGEVKEEKVSGRFLVSGSRDKTIRFWDITTGICFKVLHGHDNWVRSLKWHPSGRYLLSAADDKSIRVWDLTKINCRCVRVMDNAHPLFVSSIDFNHNFPVMASGGVDHSVKIWECR